MGLAGAAAACFEGGYVLQAYEARRAPTDRALRASLFLYLVRRRRWLVAAGLLTLGWPLPVGGVRRAVGRGGAGRGGAARERLPRRLAAPALRRGGGRLVRAGHEDRLGRDRRRPVGVRPGVGGGRGRDVRARAAERDDRAPAP